MLRKCLHVGYFGQPTYEKVNEELLLDNLLRVILNKSKLAYRIYVILIANKELKKNWLLHLSKSFRMHGSNHLRFHSL
jgi:hypothetical protein